MTDMSIIKAKLAADQVADNCLLAHFTASEPVAQKYHIGEADHHFRYLAGLLGYDVTKRVAPPEPDTADKLAQILTGPVDAKSQTMKPAPAMLLPLGLFNPHSANPRA